MGLAQRASFGFRTLLSSADAADEADETYDFRAANDPETEDRLTILEWESAMLEAKARHAKLEKDFDAARAQWEAALSESEYLLKYL